MMMNQKTWKLPLFILVTTVSFFAISFFMLGSSFTGLSSHTYNYGWFFNSAYAIRPSFVVIIAVASIGWTILLIKTLRLINKKMAAFGVVLALYSVAVLFLAVGYLTFYCEWWPNVFAMLATDWKPLLMITGISSLLFLPATLVIGIIWFALELNNLNCANTTTFPTKRNSSLR